MFTVNLSYLGKVLPKTFIGFELMKLGGHVGMSMFLDGKNMPRESTIPGCLHLLTCSGVFSLEIIVEEDEPSIGVSS